MSNSNNIKPITLTKQAAGHISAELEKSKQNNPSIIGLKLGIKMSGCSGYSYVLDWVSSDAPDLDDYLVFNSHNIDIYVDHESYKVIAGTEVDYVQQGISRVMVFHNPQAAAECGCGESFTVDQDKA